MVAAAGKVPARLQNVRIFSLEQPLLKKMCSNFIFTACNLQVHEGADKSEKSKLLVK